MIRHNTLLLNTKTTYPSEHDVLAIVFLVLFFQPYPQPAAPLSFFWHSCFLPGISHGNWKPEWIDLSWTSQLPSWL